MAAIGFGIKNFDFFFDRTIVEKQLSKQERKILSGTGAFGRKTMRRFIRKAPSGKRKQNRSSLFPRYHSHPNSGLRLILFSYSPATQSVVIGPQHFGETVFNRTFKKGRMIHQKSSKPVPQLLNEGGVASRTVRYKSGKRYKRRLKYRAHPYADRAMVPTVQKLQQLIQEIGLI